MPEDNAKTPLPPYLAFKSFLNFIDALRKSGLPGRIDKSVMSGQSGGTQSSLMQTMKFLKLIEEDGTPTPTLVALVKQSSEDSKKAYAELAAKHYSFVATKGVNLETATEGQLEEVFRSFYSGDTVRKAMTFYILLATEAGMKVSAHLKAAKRKATGNGGSATRRPRKKGGEGSGVAFTPPAPPPAPDGHRTYQLDLAVEGTRFVKMTAPINLTAAEIERIKGWMGFQFNIHQTSK